MRILRKTYAFIAFVGFYLVKLVQANLYMAYDILTPRMLDNPGFAEIRLDLKTDFGLLLFSNLVSMTPGTLSIDIDRKREILLVHLLYMDKREATEKEIMKIMKRIRRFTE